MGLPTSPAALGERHLEGLQGAQEGRRPNSGIMALWPPPSGWGWAVLIKPAYRRLFAAQTVSRWAKPFNAVALAVLVARTLTSSKWPSVPGRGL
jgi:hypothetical protein